MSMVMRLSRSELLLRVNSTFAGTPAGMTPVSEIFPVMLANVLNTVCLSSSKAPCSRAWDARPVAGSTSLGAMTSWC